jgi:PAS domain S-box-containing protein
MTDKITSHFCNLILENIPVAVVTMDAGYNITYLNRPAEDLTGFSATEAIGKPCSEILYNEKCDSECPVKTLKELGESLTGLEAELVNRYGEHISVRISASRIEGVDGEHVGSLEVIEDISREKNLEKEKDNFQFMLAHDMKSPLISIMGLIKRIREHHDDMSSEKLELYLKTIKDSGEQLESQVKEFLEYSRQATGKIKLNLEYVDLPQLIDELVIRHQQQTVEKKLSICKEYDPIQSVKIDRSQMQRVVENLMDNAIKFSQSQGKIIISLKEAFRSVVIQVRDNGPGIASEELPYIFDAFHQSKSNSKGHGLGLAAVKAIVQEHGGRVSVKSTPKKGSVFTVRIPQK